MRRRFVFLLLIVLLFIFGCNNKVINQDNTNNISNEVIKEKEFEFKEIITEDNNETSSVKQIIPQTKDGIFYAGNRAYIKESDEIIKYSISRENNTISLNKEIERMSWEYFLNNKLDANTEIYKSEIIEKFK